MKQRTLSTNHIVVIIVNLMFVLELNCRFGGQYPFSHLAGVNYPKQIVRWLLGEETDPSLLNAKINVLSCKDLVPVVLSTKCENKENTTTTVSYGIMETNTK